MGEAAIFREMGQKLKLEFLENPSSISLGYS